LAEAIKKLALENPDTFPHPVRMVYVIGSACYILTHHGTSIDSSHWRCVRYTHNFAGKLRKFDTYTNSRFIAEFGDQTIVVKLSPPKRHGEPGYRGALHGTPAARITRPVLRGAHRRAVDAGLVPY
jgi:hypothetical protein